jgi:hypothetical protein
VDVHTHGHRVNRKRITRTLAAFYALDALFCLRPTHFWAVFGWLGLSESGWISLLYAPLDDPL